MRCINRMFLKGVVLILGKKGKLPRTDFSAKNNTELKFHVVS